MIRDTWYAVGRSTEFGRDLQEQRVAGLGLVMWRTEDGEVVALDGRCCHKRFPLWEGRLLDDDVLECAYHGFAYDRSGACVQIPALHERSDQLPATAFQRKFPLIEQDGLVWVWPGDPNEAGDVAPPSTTELASAEWEHADTGDMHVEASARLLLENLFDLTHFYPLHAGNIGTYKDASVPMEIEREMRDGNPVLRTIRRRQDFAFGPMARDRFGIDVGDRIQMHELIGPGMVKLTSRIAPPGRLGTEDEQGYVLYQTVTPVTERTHVWRRYTCSRAGSRWAKDPERQSLVEAIVSGAPQVIEEDRWAVEAQQRLIENYGDEGYREVHIRTDAAVVMLRRILDDLEDPDPEPLSTTPEERLRAALRSQRARSAKGGSSNGSTDGGTQAPESTPTGVGEDVR